MEILFRTVMLFDKFPVSAWIEGVFVIVICSITVLICDLLYKLIVNKKEINLNKKGEKQ